MRSMKNTKIQPSLNPHVKDIFAQTGGTCKADNFAIYRCLNPKRFGLFSSRNDSTMQIGGAFLLRNFEVDLHVFVGRVVHVLEHGLV